MEKLVKKVLNDIEISKKYDAENDMTHFCIDFPQWLSKNYEKETVDLVVGIIKPVAIEEIEKMMKINN
jgi:hypothetical protein